MEREAIKERTTMGRAIAVSKGVKMGRSIGANETKEQFLSKHRDIQKFLSKRNADETTSLRDIAKLTGKSVNTIQKVIKALGER
jgi:DNA invertase Pin-like site-specific DNA recombinase